MQVRHDHFRQRSRAKCKRIKAYLGSEKLQDFNFFEFKVFFDNLKVRRTSRVDVVNEIEAVVPLRPCFGRIVANVLDQPKQPMLFEKLWIEVLGV